MEIEHLFSEATAEALRHRRRALAAPSSPRVVLTRICLVGLWGVYPIAYLVALLVAIWMSRQSTLLCAELSVLVALTAPHLVVVGRLDAVLAGQATRATG